MEFKVKEKLNGAKIIVPLSILAILFGAIGAIFSEIFVVVSAAILGVLLLVEKSKWHPAFLTVVFVLLAVNIGINIYYGWLLSLFAVELLICAFVSAICFRYRFSKATCAAVLTAVYSLLIVVSLYLYGAKLVGSFSFESVVELYTDYVEKFRVEFIDKISAALASYKDKVSGQQMPIDSKIIGQLFDQAMNSVLSLLVICGFAMAGITLKVFCGLSAAICERSEVVQSWKFRTSNIFAYFFIVIFIFGGLLAAGTDSLSITVANLSNIFTFVYAYCGFTAAKKLLAKRFSPGMSSIIILIIVFMFASFALQILAIFGVLNTINQNKQIGGGTGIFTVYTKSDDSDSDYDDKT